MCRPGESGWAIIDVLTCFATGAMGSIITSEWQSQLNQYIAFINITRQMQEQSPQSSPTATNSPAQQQRSQNLPSPSHSPPIQSHRSFAPHHSEKMTEEADISLNTERADAPFLRHEGRCTRYGYFLLILAAVCFLGGATLLALFLLGGCPDNPNTTLQQQFGLYCCDQHRSNSQGSAEVVFICHNKLGQSHSLATVAGAISSILLSVVLLLYARKEYYQLDYALCDAA